MHENNNGIEEDCNWAVPSYEKVSDIKNRDAIINHGLEYIYGLFN
jgi:hypothetical protein